MSSFGNTLSNYKDTNEDRWNAGALAIPLPTFDVSANCAEVYDVFHDPGSHLAAAVVDVDSRVAGIVNRLRFLARYARRYVPELYNKRPIISLANTKPLTVDEHMPVAELGAMITLDHPDALRECFIVTSKGKYLGIGTSEALVRAKVGMLTAREAQLKTALYAARDADRTKSNFLALMSHELRTPLNAIIGFSEVLANELFGPHTVERYRDYAYDIHGAGKHLLALINDILDISKSEAGQLELRTESIDIKLLLQDCVNLLSARASDGQVLLSVEVPDPFPMLQADLLRTKQVVLNLLSNAVKFTKPGGKVQLCAELRAEGRIVIRVTDTGIGMEPEMIPIALEPFRQINSPLSRNVEGTGLGLSLAKSLTERHGGTLDIDSAPGVGTTVALTFPLERTVYAGATSNVA